MMAWHEVLPMLGQLQAPVVQEMGSALPLSYSTLVFLGIPGYRIYSINRPGRLLNFWTFGVGAFSRWALIRGWALFILQQNNKC